MSKKLTPVLTDPKRLHLENVYLEAGAEKREINAIEYEAAKWFGPWTVLLNRRSGGTLFRTGS